MLRLNMTDKEYIVLLGDIHGEFNKLAYEIKNYYKHKNCYIISVGDFGLGFHNPNHEKIELRKLGAALKNNNIHLYVIRGNHDDPSYFKETNNPFDYENITLLKDYSELTLLGKNILLVGGAISVDRRFRVLNKSYWIDEKFILKTESEFPYKDRQYDLVVTHTRPGICGAFKGFSEIEYWCENDKDLKNELIEESNNLDILYHLTKPKYFCYGHFHKSSVSKYENTEFRCLDIDEHWMLPL